MSAKTPKTKEQLLRAMVRARDAGVGGLAAGLLADKDAANALVSLVDDAGSEWRMTALACWDFRGVNEQGLLIAAGQLDLRFYPEALPPPAPDDLLTWKAGEHLDAVLDRGREQVWARAWRGIGEWFFAKPLKTLRYLPEKPVEGTIGWALSRSPGFLENPAQPPVDVAKTRASLRERGFDLVPLLRQEDLRAWLLSIGFEDCGPGAVQRKRDGSDMVLVWRSPMHHAGLPLEDCSIAGAASLLAIPAREVRAAIEAHLNAPKEVAPSVLVLEALPSERSGALVLKLPSGRTLTLEGGQRLLAERIIAEGVENDLSRQEVERQLSELFKDTTSPRGGEIRSNVVEASPPGHPMQVRTASGRDVDLRDPANIRRGMVFWSRTFLQLQGRRFTCGEVDRGDCWLDAHDRSLGTNISVSAERFLGCTPGIASDDDVAEFGVAPPDPKRMTAEEIQMMVGSDVRVPGASGRIVTAEGSFATARRPDKLANLVDPRPCASPAVPQIRQFMTEHDRGVLWTSPYLFDATDLEDIVANELKRDPTLRILVVRDDGAKATRFIGHMHAALLRGMAKPQGANKLTMRGRPDSARYPSLLSIDMATAMSGAALAGSRIDRVYLFEAISPRTAGRPEQRVRMAEWFRDGLSSRLSENARVYLIGQPTHADDLAHALARYPSWPSHTYLLEGWWPLLTASGRFCNGVDDDEAK